MDTNDMSTEEFLAWISGRLEAGRLASHAAWAASLDAEGKEHINNTISPIREAHDAIHKRLGWATE